MADAPIEVEVAFALSEQQCLVSVELEPGSTVADAIRAADVARRFPEWNLAELSVGIWGRATTRDRVLAAGDRVEIYRPLQIDPREARRQLAEAGQTMAGASEDP